METIGFDIKLACDVIISLKFRHFKTGLVAVRNLFPYFHRNSDHTHQHPQIQLNALSCDISQLAINWDHVFVATVPIALVPLALIIHF